jgi:hypothetical protein
VASKKQDAYQYILPSSLYSIIQVKRLTLKALKQGKYWNDGNFEG